ncbi:VC0807 family protein [Paenibacillus humicola]|uniref:VC0807 family protein n=1 Tax=Paenibacillus humicola TaxID=3110540 RepID=UPI00237B26D7|nr:VC0807 family protein [Paenibacillus humicola]
MNPAANKIQMAAPSKFKALFPILFDLIVPVIGYYILHQLGIGDVVALTVSGMAAGASTTVQTIRRRRLDGVGMLVVIEIVFSIALLFWTNDPRVFLIKPSFYVAVAAIYAWVTCFTGRPFTFDASKPMATKGDPIRTAAYERAWERSERFRRGEKWMTAGWGIALMAEAILRIVVVYRIPGHEVGRALTLSQIPAIVIFVLAILFTRWCLGPLKKIVDGYCEEIIGEQKR